MFPLPALPLVPKLHSFFEPEQAKTFALVFGIALLAQFLLPGSGPNWFTFNAASIWPLLVGVGVVVLSFVPGLADKLKPNLFFLIVAGAGVLGVLWSFAGLAGTPFFWFGGFGLIGLATAVTSLFLWKRNGYQQLYWTLLLSGLIGMVLSLLIPLGYGLPLVAIFTQIGGGALGVISGIISLVLCLGFIFLLVLLVMNVLLKKEEADPEQVERFGSALYILALAIPFVVSLINLPMFATMLHFIVVTGIFLWLTIWGLVCLFEARAKGENLLSFA